MEDIPPALISGFNDMIKCFKYNAYFYIDDMKAELENIIENYQRMSRKYICERKMKKYIILRSFVSKIVRIKKAHLNHVYSPELIADYYSSRHTDFMPSNYTFSRNPKRLEEYKKKIESFEKIDYSFLIFLNNEFGLRMRTDWMI